VRHFYFNLNLKISGHIYKCRKSANYGSGISENIVVVRHLVVLSCPVYPA
jgi:hypothetical protein